MDAVKAFDAARRLRQCADTACLRLAAMTAEAISGS
jgi:hypothetical protein